MAMLDDREGIGLIQRERQGFGRTNMIYVMNFVPMENEDPGGRALYYSGDRQQGYWNQEGVNYKDGRVYEGACTDGESNRSGGMTVPQEIREPNSHQFENRTARSPEIELQEVRKSDPNKTDYNKTYRSETDLLLPSRLTDIPREYERIPVREEGEEITPVFPGRFIPVMDPGYFAQSASDSVDDTCSDVEILSPDQTDQTTDETPPIDLPQTNSPFSSNTLQQNERDRCGPGSASPISPTVSSIHTPGDSPVRAQIRENIGYDRYMREGSDIALFKAFYEILCHYAESNCKDPIRVNGIPTDPGTVRAKLLTLTDSHMEYVIREYKEKSRNGNIRYTHAYMLTMLFNAPEGLEAHITQLVEHDMYGGGWEEKGVWR